METDRGAGGVAARWDARYAAAGPEGPFGGAPNAWMQMALARPGVAPRSALMLADGDGRNGAWLAGRGLAVTALDISAEATRRAAARDRAAAAGGGSVMRIVADLETWAPPAGAAWDLATLLYLQGPGALRRRALALAAGALAPGGWLLVEGFAAVAGRPAMGPDDQDKRYRQEDLAAAAAGLEIVEALAGAVLLDEGARHQGPAEVVRLLARRPG
ncbi:hypothetical protein LNKW23_46570 [Paralimibaculum aggregatum]|uniref:Methyltransferase domain-containing protein n=1 Tax=Paralimibaculum aggregatum TaxID=3036245 RepID=A0ABQ6LTR5_9RHOB|nr:methyltransferase domain-containing protein [Limibaculum sp. NKW23]GMG85437.1 hypothetical protein LNKW23_46570 [Limibaculum sp. NKW23]